MYATLKNYQIQLRRKMKNKSPVQLVLKSMICTNDERIRLKKTKLFILRFQFDLWKKNFGSQILSNYCSTLFYEKILPVIYDTIWSRRSFSLFLESCKSTFNFLMSDSILPTISALSRPPPAPAELAK